MTEAGHQMTSNPLPPGRARRRARSASRPAPRSASSTPPARDVAPGAAGEVAIRGPGLTPGYLNNEQANAEAFFDGWFRTGDEGALEDGYLRLRGRLKEMIIRGGENISPHEVEAVLLAHPQVAEAVAFGVADDKYGQTVAAAVVLRGEATAEELRGDARRSLAAFKVPDRIHIVERDPQDAHRQGAALADGGPPRGRRRGEVRGARRGRDRRLRGRRARTAPASDVTLIARGEHLRAMAEHGVRVHSPRGDFEAHPAATVGHRRGRRCRRRLRRPEGLQPARDRARDRPAAAAGRRRGRRPERHPLVVLPAARRRRSTGARSRASTRAAW